MRGQHKPGYKRPRVGEKRKTRQPFRLDKLSQEVRDAVQTARSKGMTWEETAALASELAGEKLWPSNCQDWYEERMVRVKRAVMADAAKAEGIAKAFAANGFDKLPEAVRSALATSIFALTEATDPGDRAKFRKELLALGHLLSEMQRTDLKREELTVEKGRLAQAERKLELMSEKIHGLKETASKKKVTAEELQAKIDDLYGITTSPVAAARIEVGRRSQEPSSE
jgi:hypothetical protein